MILTAHAAAGAAIAATFKSNPWLGLALAFLSHFALDAVPHWHYPIKRLKRELQNSNRSLPKLNGGLVKDLAAIGADFAAGVGISVLAGAQFAPEHILLVLGGAVLGTIPDFFQLLYFLFRVFPFTQIQRFHVRIHSKKRLDNRPFPGISSQLFILAVCIFLVYLA